MDTKAYFQRLVTEAGRLSHIQNVRKELEKLSGEVKKEVKKVDLRAALPPKAQKTILNLTKRYKVLVKNLESRQKQLEQEVEKAYSNVKKSARDIEVALSRYANLKKASGTTKKKATRKAASKTSRKATRKKA